MKVLINSPSPNHGLIICLEECTPKHRTLQYFSQDVFLTAEYCLISCIEECSPKHRHVLILFYKLAHTSTRQDITTFQSRCFLNSRALSHQLYRRMFSQAQACANIILQVSSYQYQAGHYSISVKMFSQQQSIVSSVVSKNVLPSTGMC